MRGVTVTEGAAIAGGATIADGTVLAGGALGIQVTYGAAVVVSMPVLAPVTFNREKPELFPKPVTSMGNSDAPRPEMGEIIFHGADPDLLDEYYRLKDIDPARARAILAEANRRAIDSGAAVYGPPNLPSVKKGIFGTRGPHAVARGVERSVFDSSESAEEALKNLVASLKGNGFPSGTIPDTARPDSVLVPIGNGGLAVFRVRPNGTAELRTVLNQIE